MELKTEDLHPDLLFTSETQKSKLSLDFISLANYLPHLVDKMLLSEENLGKARVHIQRNTQ